MLKRDYLIRMIEEFRAAIGRFLEKEIDKRREEDLADLYRQYVGDMQLLRNLTWEEAIDYAFNQWDEEQRLQKLEMLADLWYAEGNYVQQPLRSMLLDKAHSLYVYIDTHATEYSMERVRRIKDYGRWKRE